MLHKNAILQKMKLLEFMKIEKMNINGQIPFIFRYIVM